MAISLVVTRPIPLLDQAQGGVKDTQACRDRHDSLLRVL